MIAFATSGGTDPPFLATWPMDYLTGVIRLKHITRLHTENLQKQTLPLAQVADRNS